MKKVVTIILTIMLLSLMPYIASATNTDSGICGANGDNLTWTLDENGTLIISGEGDMANYDTPNSSNSRPWANAKTVIIENGVTSIGSYAFASCGDITSVSLPNSVTELGYCAFAYCTGLSDLPMSDGIIKIDDSAFMGCSGLSSVTIPANVASLGRMAFYNCSALEKVHIEEGLTSIGMEAFWNCSNLSEINIPSSVTYIDGDAFKDTAIYYNNLDSGVLYIDDCLIYADKSISGTYAVDNGTRLIACGAFSNCSELTEITLPDSLKNINRSAFSGCSGLTEIIIPDNVTTIETSTFIRCSNLSSIKIGKSVNNIDTYAFDAVNAAGFAPETYNNLTDIYVDTDNTSYTSIDGVLYNKDMTELVKYPARKTLTEYKIADGVTKICDYAFADCDSLNNIMIPKSTTNIADSAFNRCNGLKAVFYTGSSREWKDISIGENNEILSSASIRYNAVGTASPIILDTVTATAKSGTVEITIPLESVEYDSNIIAVVFNNGAIAGVKFETISAGDTNKTITVKAETADTVKPLIWDSLNGMRPLCEAKTVTIE
ncbi:MAG: leucine-rich repeat domain-containing protein [Oscillospiraceae bacterium]|nr:leucine-rich repeat domain-containing protein [Oscillospiraceae bacterium]